MHKKYDISAYLYGLEKLNICLTENQIDQFLYYYEILVDWNRVMNLTTITDFQEVIDKHFLDSLFLVRNFPDMSG